MRYLPKLSCCLIFSCVILLQYVPFDYVSCIFTLLVFLRILIYTSLYSPVKIKILSIHLFMYLYLFKFYILIHCLASIFGDSLYHISFVIFFDDLVELSKLFVLILLILFNFTKKYVKHEISSYSTISTSSSS